MQLAPAYLTTTRLSGKKKKPNPQQVRAQQAHDRWLAERGLLKVEAKKPQKLVVDKDARIDSERHRAAFPSLGTMAPGACAKKAEQVYSGERKLLGIATLHKSCLQPVFSKDDAIEISKMRR